MVCDTLGEAVGFLLKRPDQRGGMLHFPTGGEKRRGLRKLGHPQRNCFLLNETIQIRDDPL